MSSARDYIVPISATVTSSSFAVGSSSLVLLILAFFADTLVISFAVFAALIVLASRWAAAIISAIPATIGFVNQTVHFGSMEFSPLEILILAAVAGVGLRVGLQFLRRPKFLVSQSVRNVRFLALSGFGPVALAFLALGVLSLFTVADPTHLRESIREFRWVIVEPVIFYFLARWYLNSKQSLLLSIIFFALGALTVAGSGIIEVMSGAALSVEGVSRASGVYPHPNALALFLERPFVFFAVLAVLGRDRIRVACIAIAGVIGLGVMLTFSRGALLASASTVIATLALVRRRRLALIAAGAALLLVIPLGLVAAERITSLFDGGSGSLRLSIWSSSIQMIRDHPIFGVGLDQFLYQYNPRYVAPPAWPERFTSHPHNIVLDLWLRLGIMGVVLAAVYAVILFRRVQHAVSEQRVVALAAAAAIGVGIFHGLVDNSYFLADLAVLLWFMTAVIEVDVPQRT